MKNYLARLLRKLANWLDPEPTATPLGGGPVTTDPPP